MCIIQHKIINNGKDKIIKIALTQPIDYLGYEESLDNFINETTNNNINDVDDSEKFKFKYLDSNKNNKINIYFKYYSGNTYDYNYKFIGFVEDDINFNKTSFKNSFYVIDVFDNYNTQIQNKVTSNYLTVLGNSINSNYIIDYTGNSKQLSYLYIPVNFIENVVTGNTITLYVRLSFYNAKTGKLHLFYNSENEFLLTEEKYYYKILLDKTNKSFKYIVNNIDIIPLEVINNEYIDKFNRSLTILPQKQQNYPAGNTFNYIDGTYYTSD